MLEVAYCMIHPSERMVEYSRFNTFCCCYISTPITSDSIYCGKSLFLPSSFVADISDQKIRRSNLSLSSSRGVSIRAARQRKKKSLWKT